MYDNYPVMISEEVSQPFQVPPRNWGISPTHEKKRQTEELAGLYGIGGFRQFMGSPDAPIVCVAGNHDFIPLIHLFDGCDAHELVDNEVIEVLGLRVTGHRGIPWIYGSWAHEVQRPDLSARVDAMPNADLILTHYPPLDMLDYEDDFMKGRRRFGLEDMTDKISKKMGMMGLHCFGHIHGCGGLVKVLGEGQFIGAERAEFHAFSNAAATINVIDMPW